ncbi:hypothetical protein Tco_0097342 [Tanacetum coccineum]
MSFPTCLSRHSVSSLLLHCLKSSFNYSKYRIETSTYWSNGAKGTVIFVVVDVPLSGGVVTGIGDDADDGGGGRRPVNVEPIRDADVKHSLLNANSEPICTTCKKSMFDGVHDMCLLDFVENVNSRAKSTKKNKKPNIWKPIGHVFTEVGLKWKPTSRTFTIVGNLCPLN